MDLYSEFDNTGYDYSNATVTLAVDIVYSDDDADEEGNPKTDLDKAFAHKLLFGKHKNKNLGEMLASRDRRSYLRYLLDWDDLREERAGLSADRDLQLVLQLAEVMPLERDLRAPRRGVLNRLEQIDGSW